MRKLTFLIMLSFLVTAIYAQRDGVAPLPKGGKQINFGAGFSTKGVPIYASFDFALHKDVTLTPEIHAVIPFPDEKFSGGVLVKADYHWNYLIGIPSEWDFYAGARAGFGFGDDDFFPELGIQVGGRWYWTDSWGLNAELAAGTGFGFTFGLSKKL